MGPGKRPDKRPAKRPDKRPAKRPDKRPAKRPAKRPGKRPGKRSDKSPQLWQYKDPKTGEWLYFPTYCMRTISSFQYECASRGQRVGRHFILNCGNGRMTGIYDKSALCATIDL